MSLRIALAILAAVPSSAAAHAFLLHSDPAAGAALLAAPKTVVLDFSEPLEPAFSDVTVLDQAGKAVLVAPSDTSGTQMTVMLPALKPGSYRVVWHAFSLDTHRTQGSFSFAVRPK